MSRSPSIQRRLLTDQVLLILLLGAALLGTTFLGARRALQDVSRTIIERSLDQADTGLRRFFDPIDAALAALAGWSADGRLALDDPASVEGLVTPVVGQLPQVSGVVLATGSGEELFLQRSGDRWRQRVTTVGPTGLVTKWLEADADIEPGTDPGAKPGERQAGYDPRSRPWYIGALEGASGGERYWTEPYEFFATQAPGMTVSVASSSATEKGARQVSALDVTISDLTRYTRGIDVSPRGSVWILMQDGRLLGWPDDEEIWRGRDPSEALLKRPAELGVELVDDAIEELLSDRSVTGETGRFDSGGEEWWAAARPFQLSPERALAVVVMVPTSDLLGERQRLRLWILGLTLAALLGALARAAVLARRFSRPIEALVAESDRMSQGDLEPGPAISSRLAEVDRLTEAHERMRVGLKTLLKLEGDLEIAREIQQRTFPTDLPELPGFDVEAWSQPADETGGDSYDVIGLDADGAIAEGGEVSRLVLLLADATGHGIGPALSVTQLRAMLRMAIRAGCDPRQMATHINQQLHADLPANRFITAWLGRLDGDGTLATFSAAQAPLLLYRAASDEVEVLGSNATPFGLLPMMPVMPPPAIELAIGDVYVALSDGFYEAADDADEEVGTDRIAATLRAHHASSAADILTALRRTVDDFTDNAPLDDDRTAVIVKRTGAAGGDGDGDHDG